jgi:hypothetical protein
LGTYKVHYKRYLNKRYLKTKKNLNPKPNPKPNPAQSMKGLRKFPRDTRTDGNKRYTQMGNRYTHTDKQIHPEYRRAQRKTQDAHRWKQQIHNTDATHTRAALKPH